MSEFYGEKGADEIPDPADDPLLTVRIQPPNTQARRLDLATPRAVRVSKSDIAAWATVNWPSFSTFVDHDRIADWPIEHPITYGAAARLARAVAQELPSPPKVMESDEDASPFR